MCHYFKSNRSTLTIIAKSVMEQLISVSPPNKNGYFILWTKSYILTRNCSAILIFYRENKAQQAIQFKCRNDSSQITIRYFRRKNKTLLLQPKPPSRSNHKTFSTTQD